MVVVLVDEISNRVNYTFDFIFGVRNVDFSITSDLNQFKDSEGVKFNYSSNSLYSIPYIQPSGLLNGIDIWKGSLDIAVSDSVEWLSFDSISDPVASIFYVLTRMEEYNCETYDEHNRYPYAKSILKRNDWIEKAMCDRWSEYLIKNLLNLDFELKPGEFVPTFDIDNTYAYRLKSGKRQLLSKFKDLAKMDKRRLKERRSVAKGDKDPYDTFDKIKQVGEKFKAAKVFWLTESNGSKDRNIPLDNSEHQALIKELSNSIEINIHPSYGSFSNSDQIQLEKRNLKSITGNKIENSRQHFLRFQLPNSYRDLIKAGIKDDYSMGFAQNVGFRSGTARPHKWFDLGLNEISELTVHPFVYMDGTLLEYMGMSIEESKMKIQSLYDEVQSYGGDFVFLWHNETIGDYGKWKGWLQVLEFTLNLKNE